MVFSKRVTAAADEAFDDATFATLKERHRAEKQRLIERAAASVFARKGFANTTVAEVAEAAGISPGAIYLYFSSREELLFATVLDQIDELEARMRAAATASEPADVVLRQMMDAYYGYFRDRPEGFRMLTAGLDPAARRKADPSLVSEYDRRAVVCLELLSETLERGIGDGTFAAGDVGELTQAIWAAAHGSLQLALAGERGRFLGRDVKQVFDRTADVLIDGMRSH